MSKEELIRRKKCLKLNEYYSNIDSDLIDEASDFLKKEENNEIIANKNILSFINGDKIIKTRPLISKNNSIDSIRISNSAISLVPCYDSYYSNFGIFRRKKRSRDDDSDSNNCNNNNNNNNNNNA